MDVSHLMSMCLNYRQRGGHTWTSRLYGCEEATSFLPNLMNTSYHACTMSLSNIKNSPPPPRHNLGFVYEVVKEHLM